LSFDSLDVVSQTWLLPNIIDDWSLLVGGIMKADPSLFSICMHAIFEMDKGMCKELILTDLNTSSGHDE